MHNGPKSIFFHQVKKLMHCHCDTNSRISCFDIHGSEDLMRGHADEGISVSRLASHNRHEFFTIFKRIQVQNYNHSI